MENKPNRIIWHHTADSFTGPQFGKINEYHKSKGFPKSILGYFGGYHILIEKNGTISRYRADNEIGAHDADENINSLGVAMSGNFSIEKPTKEQEYALRKQLIEWQLKWNIPITRIDPHRMGDSTECPGKLLSDNWARELLQVNETQETREVLEDIIKFCQDKLNATY